MKIDHIGIVVNSIDEALGVYKDALGLPLGDVMSLPDDRVEVAFLPLGESNIELIQPTAGDTGIARFLSERGGGLHHVCIEVENIDSALSQLKAHSVQLIDETPRAGAHGRVAFVHPKGTHGVLVELVEREH